MKWRHTMVYVVSALALFLTACPDSGTGGGDDDGDGDGDAAVDTGGDAGMDTGPPPDDTEMPDDSEMPDDTSDTSTDGDNMDMDDDTDGGGDDMMPAGNLYYFTSGGGVLTSSGYKAVVSFGAPSPRGTVSSSNYQMRVAPASP